MEALKEWDFEASKRVAHLQLPSWLEYAAFWLDWLLESRKGQLATIASIVLSHYVFQLGFGPSTVLAIVISLVVGVSLKYVFHTARPPHAWVRTRPWKYHTGQGPSFPSGAATVAAAIAFNIYLWLPSLAPFLLLYASAACFVRVFVGDHFCLDVLGGAVVGVCTTLAMHMLLGTERYASLPWWPGLSISIFFVVMVKKVIKPGHRSQ